MTDPYGTYNLTRSQSWPAYNPCAHQPSNHTQNAIEEEGEDDEEESDDDTDTVTGRPSTPTLNQFWSCVSCWNRRSSSEDRYCNFCQSSTSTIKRWRSSNKPVVEGPDGDSIGQDGETPWICSDCGNPKLFLGGDTHSEPVFESYCPECEEKTDTVYADHAASYCCCDCRYERPSGTMYQLVRGVGVEAWKENCARCEEETDTVKLDAYQDERYCCLVCRGDRKEGEGRQWCEACRRRTTTTEIDDVVDQDEYDTIPEEDEGSDEE